MFTTESNLRTNYVFKNDDKRNSKFYNSNNSNSTPLTRSSGLPVVSPILEPDVDYDGRPEHHAHPHREDQWKFAKGGHYEAKV